MKILFTKVSLIVSVLVLITSAQASALTETYWLLSDPKSSSNGQTISNNTIDLSYDIYTSQSENLFYNFWVCPYVENDTGDNELMPSSYCKQFYVDQFSGTYQTFETSIAGTAQLIYPGINNVKCVIFSDQNRDEYQECTSTLRINYTGKDFPVYRFWSNNKQHHFYTIDHNEKRSVDNNYDDNTWKYEQMAWTGAQYTGSCSWGSPIYRFWSDQKQGHFFTIDAGEKSYVESHYPSNVWRYEGIAYCAQPVSGDGSCSIGSPIYRFWSDDKQGHFYTNSSDEKNQVQSNYPSHVWRFEQIAYCAK